MRVRNVAMWLRQKHLLRGTPIAHFPAPASCADLGAPQTLADVTTPRRLSRVGCTHCSQRRGCSQPRLTVKRTGPCTMRPLKHRGVDVDGSGAARWPRGAPCGLLQYWLCRLKRNWSLDRTHGRIRQPTRKRTRNSVGPQRRPCALTEGGELVPSAKEVPWHVARC